MDSKLLDTWGSSPRCLPRDLFQPDIKNSRPTCEPAPPQGWCPVASLKQGGYPLSDFANTHAWGPCHPPAPEPSTCSINRLVIRVLSYRQQFPGQHFCQLAFHHHLSGRPARIPESCAESSIASLWVQLLASVQEWCEREGLWNQTHPGLFHIAP